MLSTRMMFLVALPVGDAISVTPASSSNGSSAEREALSPEEARAELRMKHVEVGDRVEVIDHKQSEHPGGQRTQIGKQGTVAEIDGEFVWIQLDEDPGLAPDRGRRFPRKVLMHIFAEGDDVEVLEHSKGDHQNGKLVLIQDGECQARGWKSKKGMMATVTAIEGELVWIMAEAGSGLNLWQFPRDVLMKVPQQTEMMEQSARIQTALLWLRKHDRRLAETNRNVRWGNAKKEQRIQRQAIKRLEEERTHAEQQRREKEEHNRLEEARRLAEDKRRKEEGERRTAEDFHNTVSSAANTMVPEFSGETKQDRKQRALNKLAEVRMANVFVGAGVEVLKHTQDDHVSATNPDGMQLHKEQQDEQPKVRTWESKTGMRGMVAEIDGEVVWIKDDEARQFWQFPRKILMYTMGEGDTVMILHDGGNHFAHVLEDQKQSVIKTSDFVWKEEFDGGSAGGPQLQDWQRDDGGIVVKAAGADVWIVPFSDHENWTTQGYADCLYQYPRYLLENVDVAAQDDSDENDGFFHLTNGTEEQANDDDKQEQPMNAHSASGDMDDDLDAPTRVLRQIRSTDTAPPTSNSSTQDSRVQNPDSSSDSEDPGFASSNDQDLSE